MHATLTSTTIRGPFAPARAEPLSGRRVHMIGIGGSGMSGAAALLRDLGATVSGSDLGGFDGLGSLVQSGVRVAIGHDLKNIDPSVELVILSAAVPDTNPEWAEAKRRGLPVMKYADLLGSLMERRIGVAIAGTHGKSTTTAMTAFLFREADLSPTFLIGARSGQLGGGSGVGKGPHFIVESCEFDRSFLRLSPRQAAILNIEPDHLDCYQNLDDIAAAFGDFAARVDGTGFLICNGDDPLARRAASRCTGKVETFGDAEDSDWRAEQWIRDSCGFRFDVTYKDEAYLSTRLSVAGRHNVRNALAAIALAHHAGVEAPRIADILPRFEGVYRRLTWRGEGRGVTVLDDYAHHPTEIRVTIEAARSRYSPKRTWVVFQPHQYSRTRHLMAEFAESFSEADEILIPDVYQAREASGPLGRQASEELVSRIGRCGRRARYVESLSAVTEYLTNHVVDGDLVMTMGAGDVWKVADELVERLCGSDRARRAARAADLVSTGGACAIPVSAA